MKSVVTPIAKSILILLRLSAGMSAADAAIKKKIYESGTTALTTSKTVMKIVKSLEESRLLIKWISETIKNEAKEQKGGYPPMLLRILGVSILGNALTRKGVTRAGEGVIRAGQNF